MRSRMRGARVRVSLCDEKAGVQESLPDPATTAAAAAAARPAAGGPRPAPVAPIATPQTVAAAHTRGTAVAVAAAVAPARAAVPPHNPATGSANPHSFDAATQGTPAMPSGAHVLQSQGPSTTAPDLRQPADLTTPATPPNLRAAQAPNSAAAQPHAPSIVLPRVMAPQAQAAPSRQAHAMPPAMTPIEEDTEMHVDEPALEQTFARHPGHAGPVLPAAGTAHSDGDGGTHSAVAAARPQSAGRTQGARQSVFSQHLVKLAQQLEQRERAAAGSNGVAPGIASPGGAAAASVERVSMRPPDEEEEGFWASQGDGEFGADDEECLATPADERPQTTLFPGL